MLDIKYIRENPELVKANTVRRGCDVDVDALLKIDAEHRELINRVETLRADRNRLSKECRDNPEAREQVKALKQELSKLEEQLTSLDSQLKEQLDRL